MESIASVPRSVVKGVPMKVVKLVKVLAKKSLKN